MGERCLYCLSKLGLFFSFDFSGVHFLGALELSGKEVRTSEIYLLFELALGPLQTRPHLTHRLRRLQDRINHHDAWAVPNAKRC